MQMKGEKFSFGKGWSMFYCKWKWQKQLAGTWCTEASFFCLQIEAKTAKFLIFIIVSYSTLFILWGEGWALMRRQRRGMDERCVGPLIRKLVSTCVRFRIERMKSYWVQTVLTTVDDQKCPNLYITAIRPGQASKLQVLHGVDASWKSFQIFLYVCKFSLLGLWT
jgi:hypothetical protein